MIKARLVLLVALITITGCGATGGDEGAPVRTVVPGKLVACAEVPYEPFSITSGDAITGVDVDLVRAIAQDLKLQAEIRNATFDDIFEDMRNGKCDLVASAVSITPDRQSRLLFTDPYFEVNQSLAVRAVDAERLNGITAMRGQKLGAIRGTTSAEYAATRAGREAVVEFDLATDMVNALQRSEIAGIVQDFPMNSYLAVSRPADFRVVQIFTDVEREQYGFALAPGNEVLRDRINRALARIRDDGRYDDILRRYLGAAVG